MKSTPQYIAKLTYGEHLFKVEAGGGFSRAGRTYPAAALDAGWIGCLLILAKKIIVLGLAGAGRGFAQNGLGPSRHFRRADGEAAPRPCDGNI